jgi:NAD(P)H dehydrogenase (quinone)
MMYAITGITGKVGGELARTLLAVGEPVRAVVRVPKKGQEWAALGCEIALANIEDTASLTIAFRGTEGVFVLVPPNFDPAPEFPEARAIAATLRTALEAARPARVVYLSTIGAQASETNLLTQHTIIEATISELPTPIAFLRPAWFMENFAWDVASARDSGVITSFLQPLDKSFPMIATADVGRVAAELIQEDWNGCRVIELEAARRITPNEVAATFSKILGHPVRIEAVPRASWDDLFKSQGMKNPTPRIQMLDGFNEGWIEFERGESGSVKGNITLESVLRGLIERAA